jgi:Protein of unknown function, DUF547
MPPRLLFVMALCAGALTGLAPVAARQSPPTSGFNAPLDAILDLYVRDGLVYYRALESDRRKLDAFVASLDGPAAATVDRWPTEEQIAFWLNAYNALVLETVVDHYPIRGHVTNYPPDSIRQIPGAFERITHRVAGRSLTLDQIETTVIAGFHDPRLYLALGRGAVGSPRLRSEAYTASRIGEELASVAGEFATGGRLFVIDSATDTVTVTSLVSWRQSDFVGAYAAAADPRYAARSPIERAVLALVHPSLLTHEREYLQGNQFRMAFGAFDWRLNDLTGGRLP